MTRYLQALVLLLTCSSVCVLCYEQVYPPVNENDSTTDVFFALMVSFSSRFNSSANVVGVKVALDMINSDPYLLPGYTLHYVLSDSEVSWKQPVRLWSQQINITMFFNSCIFWTV